MMQLEQDTVMGVESLLVLCSQDDSPRAQVTLKVHLIILDHESLSRLTPRIVPLFFPLSLQLTHSSFFPDGPHLIGSAAEESTSP